MKIFYVLILGCSLMCLAACGTDPGIESNNASSFSQEENPTETKQEQTVVTPVVPIEPTRTNQQTTLPPTSSPTVEPSPTSEPTAEPTPEPESIVLAEFADLTVRDMAYHEGFLWVIATSGIQPPNGIFSVNVESGEVRQYTIYSEPQ